MADMSGVSKYACHSCQYVAYNRRMLAQHVARVHATKVYKCPMCPFISCYQANFYRHKRLIHRQGRSSRIEGNGNDGHVETDPNAQFSSETEPRARQIDGSILHSETVNSVQEREHDSQESVATLIVNNGYPDLFNGFVDDAFQLHISQTGRSETFQDAVEEEYVDPDVGEKAVREKPKPKTFAEMPRATITPSSGHLTPVRFKRTYTCEGCDLSTTNPREFLAHRRDVHLERINIYECTLCMYASKNIQKLQRHYGLIHKEAPKVNFHAQLALKEPTESQQPAQEVISEEIPEAETPKSLSLKTKKATLATQTLKCSKCLFTTRSKFLLSQHEKNDHLKRKFFRCLQCGYVTNERGRYTKHVKYHSMPKQKCSSCDFETPYQWNMDRHIKNHMTDGDYKCSKCSFTAEGPKSLAFHLANHHRDNQLAAPSGENAEEEIDVVTLDANDEEQEEEEEVQGGGGGAEGVEEDEMEELQNESDIFAEDEEEPVPYDGLPDMRPSSPDKIRMFPTRRQTLPSEKKLKCKFCAYRTAWHSDLRRHELAHKTNKKHQCPLCGIRFDNLALVSRHLGRMHSQESEAKNIASMIQLLTNRKKVASAKALSRMPVLQRVDSRMVQRESVSLEAAPSYQNPPLIDAIQPAEKLPRIGPSLKRKMSLLSPSSKVKKQKTHGSMTCNVCGYRTKWISELEKHMRVHSAEKPFSCPHCEYSSKWKGDLTRHIQKYHEKSDGSKAQSGLDERSGSPHSPDVSQASNASNDSKTYDMPHANSSSFEEDGPLDLTITKPMKSSKYERLKQSQDTEFVQQKVSPSSSIQTIDVVDTIKTSNTLRALLTRSQEAEKKSTQKKHEEVPNSDKNCIVKQVKKYKCPFCSFMTRTASRFHVHIIQHYNKRPFMCSACGKKSNWQWDITKHIKVKAERDPSHVGACVLLTDESGRKNYDKYDEFLVKVQEKVPATGSKAQNQSESNSASEISKLESEQYDDQQQQQQQQQFVVTRNEAPENIVVTPDISFVSEDSGQEGGHSQPPPLIQMQMTQPPPPSSGGKYFQCAHCEYRHHEKKVLVGHLSVHAGISPYRCRICGFSSNWRQVMIRHVKGRHNGRLKDLQECFSFVQEDNYIRLLGLIENERPKLVSDVGGTGEIYECGLCPYKCDKPFFLRMHVRMHEQREGANYKCQFCPYYVKFKKTLAKHMRLHRNFPVAGGEGGMLPTENGEMVMRENYPMNLFQPNGDDDAVTVASPSHYKSTKRYACEACPYQTDNKTYLLYHRQFHRPNKNAPFKCQYCSYWAYYSHLLQQHEKIHQAVSPSQQIHLTIDPQATMAADGMEIKGPKMFKCRFCPMTNKRLANVKSHEKMHWKHGALMHSCHLCSYKCGNRGVLTAHVKKVHNQYPLPPWVGRKESAPIYSTHSEQNAVESQPETVAPSKKARFTYYCEHCPAAFKSASDYNTHSSFHGANLPFSCSYCTYRARHKPHLHKHMVVHTPEYIAKRAIQPPVMTSPSPAPQQTATSTPVSSPSKSSDQMLLLEETETKAYVSGNGGRGRVHKCQLCPAAFTKPTTLSFHSLLHGSNGEHKCSHCSYATNYELNYETHVQLHTMVTAMSSPAGATALLVPIKVANMFPCPKCPASFSKITRYNRHVNLHGQKSRFTCDECDYSVVNSANLVRHKKVHVKPKASGGGGGNNGEVAERSEQSESTFKVPETVVIPLSDRAATERKDKSGRSAPPSQGERVTFGCSRCPYTHNRKDAVASHMNRHCTGRGIKCPHCDYHTLQPSYITEHMKKHFEPHDFHNVDAYVHYNSLEIWITSNGNRQLLCRDLGPEKDLGERFEPPIEDQDLFDSLTTTGCSETTEKDSNKEDGASSQSNGKDNPVGNACEQESVLTDVIVQVKTEAEETSKEAEDEHIVIKQEMEDTDKADGNEEETEFVLDPQIKIKTEVLTDYEMIDGQNDVEEQELPVQVAESSLNGNAAGETTASDAQPELPPPPPQAQPQPKAFLDSEETQPYELDNGASHGLQASSSEMETVAEESGGDQEMAEEEQEEERHCQDIVQDNGGDMNVECHEESIEEQNVSTTLEITTSATTEDVEIHYVDSYAELETATETVAADGAPEDKIPQWEHHESSMDVIVEDLYPQVGDSVVEIVTDAEHEQEEPDSEELAPKVADDQADIEMEEEGNGELPDQSDFPLEGSTDVDGENVPLVES